MHRSPRLLRIASTLFLPWLAASCRDGTAPHATVLRVAVAGAPGGPELVGSTLQLSAVAEDAQGDSLGDRTVTWSSSDQKVATVSATGLVASVGAGTASIVASSEGVATTIPVDFRLGGTIGPAGGTVSVLGGAVTIVVPSGALSQPSPIMVRAVTPTADPHLVGAQVYELAPWSVVFATPASLAISYDRSRLPSGVAQADVMLGMLSGSGWIPVFGSTVDTTTAHALAPIDGAGGTYAVIWDGVARVAVTGASNPDTLYAGERLQLAAVPVDSVGHSLAGRPTTWSSSDAGVASVDSTGLVTTIAAGAAAITATVEGRSASIGVTVLPGITVDWSRAADWVGFQGDASHDGYVAATMNPRRFHELWVKTPFGGTAVNPVAAGDSAIVATTSTNFGQQHIAVLDAATGAVRWDYDFGAIDAADPPAYANGSIYVQTGGQTDSYLWSFVAATGQIRFRTPYANQWSRYAAPVVTGNGVYAGGGSFGGVYAFDASLGTTRWTAQANYEATPAVRDGFAYAYTATSPNLVALDTATGAVSFAIADSAFSGGGALSPVVGGSNDILVTNGGRLVSFDLVGRRIGWQVPGTFTGNVTVAAGVLYVANGSRIEARSESDGSLLWAWAPPDGAPAGTSIVCDNLLFVGTAANTYAVDLSLHVPVWSYHAGGSLAVSRLGLLLIAQQNGKLAAIALE